MSHKWSKFQEAIFDFVVNGSGNGCVEAVAGSGKTSTIVEAANRLPKSLTSLFLAFNKSIAEELASRLPSNVLAKTLNGLGHGAWQRAVGRGVRLRLDTAKTRGIMRDRLSEGEYRYFGEAVAKLVSLAKSSGIVPLNARDLQGLVEDCDEAWQELIDWHDVDCSPQADNRRNQKFRGDGEDLLLTTVEDTQNVVAMVRDVLAKSIEKSFDGIIDFDDQIYMTVVARAPMMQYDFIFVDEAQDLNVTQQEMVGNALARKGRLIAVGDPHQAIYGFRGADSESMKNMRERFDMVTLPLSISYRCPQLVVAEARKFVAHIEPHETAPMGSVCHLDSFHPETFTEADVILCRNTRYLVELAFNLIREKVRCKVLGRDIGAGLLALIKKMSAGSIDELMERLDNYEDREVEKFKAKGLDEKAVGVQDRVATIRVFVEQLAENSRALEALTAAINDLFSDPRKDCLILATVHKSKGMEWNRVFILNEWLMPGKYAVQEWQLQQETNLQYVAVTRAKGELHYIDSKDWRKVVEHESTGSTASAGTEVAAR